MKCDQKRIWWVLSARYFSLSSDGFNTAGGSALVYAHDAAERFEINV